MSPEEWAVIVALGADLMNCSFLGADLTDAIGVAP